MKSLKISNLVTKKLFSSEKTKKLINKGVLTGAKWSEKGGLVYSGPNSMGFPKLKPNF